MFLDIKVSRVKNSFSTNIYRKVTFSGVFTNFESFIPISYKSNLIFTLLFRAFKLCSNFELFHQEILNLKDIFKRNGYPGNFIDVCIITFIIINAQIIIVLHLLGKLLLEESFIFMSFNLLMLSSFSFF